MGEKLWSKKEDSFACLYMERNYIMSNLLFDN